MNRILKLSPILALMALAACETVQGAGRDMQAAGTAVSRESREVQSQGL
ncbi:entericidin, EcnA/B family [Paracoccus yeei]|jgi:predicted small secreted protein|uniref:Entericidin A/B family lipoprotein n=2 Tax=Paracoccus TaxID=265 RepID=A0A1V0GVB7_9RHOB|nr:MULTISPECIES: entericidin A/B family lipoprotein [Paracoccus]ARC37619.1 entericidin, EcnA/B family [Paracoccus yeei]ATQ56289.1 entericidin, EcnA/B family [Paracoccus yeei]AWX93827.1 entericidin, EcnA/B family [Paracoccus mutanolyticus]AYF00550.1 entericidin EcnAB [Paracoccus yeei]MBY0135931.1 entericidin A/B family lipoprotein [Paracoccus yeei]